MLEGTFDPMNDEAMLPSKADVERTNGERLEGSVPVHATATVGVDQERIDICETITSTEVLNALRGMRKKSACGPEGWQTVKVLWDVPARGIVAILTTFMWLSWQPKELKESRTVLIPKMVNAGQTLQTIGPYQLRLLSAGYTRK